MTSERPQAPRPPRTLRLTFEYEGDQVRLISRQSVQMRTPPPHPTSIQPGQSGFWYEVRDRDDRVLYQRALHSPIQTDTEVFSNEPGATIHRRPIENPRGTFEILVPDLPEGESVVLFSSPLEPERALRPAEEISRVELRGSAEQRGDQHGRR